jgi:RNA polymerase sigma-70 factor (ECF subfamily)
MAETPTESDWSDWVKQHAPKFLLFARQKSRCDADAQDLVQEAVAEAAARQSDGTPPPIALVYATIHRRAIDLARREDRRGARELKAVTLEETWLDTEVENRELRQLMTTALNQLPETYREVITLKVWGDLTFSEIGEALSIPANTAASRYRYGLSELRKLTKGVVA